MEISENKFRDILFENHAENFSDLIVGKRDPISWPEDKFPPLHILLQQKAEKKINSILSELEDLIITARELPLADGTGAPTRVDLFGSSESTGLTIIELKKSKQTERQSFTELLAYSNHFCSIFPGLKESAITSLLVAPMQSRTVKDAYVQELVTNNKNTVALIPSYINGEISLKVFYPDQKYYKWFQNNLLDDRSMVTVAISFEEIPGWIDTDIETEDKSIPEYSKSALNTISNTISHKLESCGIHSIVYASQKWGEISQKLPYPNTIFVAAVNPFSSFRTSNHKDEIYGESEDGRIKEVQAIHKKIDPNEREYWLETVSQNFHGRIINIVKEQFDSCLNNHEDKRFFSEISLPDWYGLKTSMIDSVMTHNLDIYPTGLLREIYSQYIEHVFEKKEDHIYYYDDLPKFPYQSFRSFLSVWEILSGLGVINKDA